MKTSALLAGLSALALISACSQSDDHAHDDHDAVAAEDHHASDDHHHAEDNDHHQDETEAHGHDDHAHSDDHHGNAGEHHAGGMPQTATLGFSLTSSPQAGSPSSVGLILFDANGNQLTASDLEDMHGHKLHVMMVDAGLEQLITLHPEADHHGEFSIDFTPDFARSYSVFANYAVTPGEVSHAEDHGHAHEEDDHGHAHEDDAHSHGDEDHAHDDEHAHDEGMKAAGYTQASSALIIGTDAPAPLPQTDVLNAVANGLTFTLTPAAAVTAGTPAQFTLSATTADGSPATGLGTSAHFTAFDAAAATMAHGHSSESTSNVSGELTFAESGPYRVFVTIEVSGETVTLPFKVQVG